MQLIESISGNWNCLQILQRRGERCQSDIALMRVS